MMNRIKFGKEERNLIIIMVGIIAISFLFWIFFYTPKKKELQNLDSKIKGFGFDIQKATIELGNVEDYEARISKMQKEIIELESRFPKEAQLSSILKYIVEEARRKYLDIDNINPGELKAYIPKNPSLDIVEINCKKMVFELRLRGRYRDLADYLRDLRENLNYIFSIEELTITKDKDILPQLRVKLGIGVYVLAMSPKNIDE